MFCFILSTVYKYCHIKSYSLFYLCCGNEICLFYDIYILYTFTLSPLFIDANFVITVVIYILRQYRGMQLSYIPMAFCAIYVNICTEYSSKL